MDVLNIFKRNKTIMSFIFIPQIALATLLIYPAIANNINIDKTNNDYFFEVSDRTNVNIFVWPIIMLIKHNLKNTSQAYYFSSHTQVNFNNISRSIFSTVNIFGTIFNLATKNSSSMWQNLNSIKKIIQIFYFSPDNLFNKFIILSAYVIQIIIKFGCIICISFVVIINLLHKGLSIKNLNNYLNNDVNLNNKFPAIQQLNKEYDSKSIKQDEIILEEYYSNTSNIIDKITLNIKKYFFKSEDRKDICVIYSLNKDLMCEIFKDYINAEEFDKNISKDNKDANSNYNSIYLYDNNNNTYDNNNNTELFFQTVNDNDNVFHFNDKFNQLIEIDNNIQPMKAEIFMSIRKNFISNINLNSNNQQLNIGVEQKIATKDSKEKPDMTTAYIKEDQLINDVRRKLKNRLGHNALQLISETKDFLQFVLNDHYMYFCLKDLTNTEIENILFKINNNIFQQENNVGNNFKFNRFLLIDSSKTFYSWKPLILIGKFLILSCKKILLYCSYALVMFFQFIIGGIIFTKDLIYRMFQDDNSDYLNDLDINDINDIIDKKIDFNIKFFIFIIFIVFFNYYLFVNWNDYFIKIKLFKNVKLNEFLKTALVAISSPFFGFGIIVKVFFDCCYMFLFGLYRLIIDTISYNLFKFSIVLKICRIDSIDNLLNHLMNNNFDSILHSAKNYDFSSPKLYNPDLTNLKLKFIIFSFSMLIYLEIIFSANLCGLLIAFSGILLKYIYDIIKNFRSITTYKNIHNNFMKIYNDYKQNYCSVNDNCWDILRAFYCFFNMIEPTGNTNEL